MSLFSVLGKVNPLRLFSGYFRRHPWQKRLLILAPFLILLALLNPVIGAVDKLISIVGRLLGPLLDTGLGRGLLLVILLLALAVGVYVFARDRVADVFRRHAMSQHLRGIEAMQLGDLDRALRMFRKVVRIGQWFDLSKGAASGYGSLRIDARLKIARIHVQRGQIRQARSQLALIPKSQLRKRLALSFAEINARVFAQHPDHLADSVLQVLEDSHKAWAAHAGIAELLADKLIEAGHGERAADVLGETLRRASKTQTPRVAGRLARLNLELAETALLDGRLKDAQRLLERALRLGENEAGLLLKADVHLAKGELEAALTVLGGLASPAAKQRLADLLRHEKQMLAPRTMLARVPRRDSLLALAEYYIERGELRRAARALQACLREGTPSPRAFAMLACIRMQEDEPTAAGQALRLALANLEGGSSGSAMPAAASAASAIEQQRPSTR